MFGQDFPRAENTFWIADTFFAWLLFVRSIQVMMYKIENKIRSVFYIKFFEKRLHLYALCVRATDAPLLLCILTKWCKSLTSLRGSGGNTGTATIPALKQAINEIVNCNPGKKTSNTLSPLDNPLPLSSHEAKVEVTRSSSLYVYESIDSPLSSKNVHASLSVVK